MALPHIHLIVVSSFGLYEVTSVNATDQRQQDVVAARYLLLVCANICCLVSEFCYVLKDNIFGQIGWFLSGILIHRCYEATLPTAKFPEKDCKGASMQAKTTRAFKLFFLKMLSLVAVFMFYCFVVGMAVVSQKSFLQGIYSFGYLAFVLFVFEISLARFIFRALYSEDDLAVGACLLLLISGHIFAYFQHISPFGNPGSSYTLIARFMEYSAQFIIATSVMKFEDKIYFKRLDYQ